MIDDWHDVLRIFVGIISVWCSYMLVMRYKTFVNDWTRKTLDYWYALLMWTFVGISSSIQGVILDRPLTPAYVCTCAAVLVTARGVHRKGSWGGTT